MYNYENITYGHAELHQDVAHHGNHWKKTNAYLTLYINSSDIILKIYKLVLLNMENQNI